MQADAKEALLDDIDEALDTLGPSRPSAPKVTRARTLLRGIKVACQNIAISPVTDSGTPSTPPTPGPETPPIEPAPPETPPSGGGGGGATSPPTTTTVTTTYTSAGDFGGTQGYRGWYYLEEDETEMTYSAGLLLWSGGETYQGIWASGQHPWSTHGAMRRWVAQAAGKVDIRISDEGHYAENVIVEQVGGIDGAGLTVALPSWVTHRCVRAQYVW